MEHFCISSYVRIMTSCAVSSCRKYDSFCEKIMLSLCPEGATEFSYSAKDGSTVTYDYTNFNKIHSAAQNLPEEVTNLPAKKGARNIEKYFIDNVIPFLEEKKKKNAVLALKHVIIGDGLPDSTQLGTICALTKGDLRKKTDFVLSEFLTDMFIFAIEKTDNITEQAFTKSITKTYCTAFDSFVDTIKFYEVTRPKAVSTIPLTSMGKFNKVFTPISTQKMAAASQRQDLQIFCMKFDDFDFDYNGLWKYLRNNIGYYVYSRSDIERYMNEEEIGSIAYDAVDHLKQIMNAKGVLPENELGEIMLYVFLEQVLGAPKFMSKVELGNYGGINVSESEGIHILTAENPIPFSQVVLGSSMIEGDLCKAIEAAFASAETLKNRNKKERRFVETKIFTETFTDKVAEQLEAIILPDGPDNKKPTTAFGIFIGYTICAVPQAGKSPEVYQDDVHAQVEADIIHNLPYIEQKISDHGLSGYSIYLYLLPFHDADSDKKSIMDNLLLMGGGN